MLCRLCIKALAKLAHHEVFERRAGYLLEVERCVLCAVYKRVCKVPEFVREGGIVVNAAFSRYEKIRRVIGVEIGCKGGGVSLLRGALNAVKSELKHIRVCVVESLVHSLGQLV